MSRRGDKAPFSCENVFIRHLVDQDLEKPPGTCVYFAFCRPEFVLDFLPVEQKTLKIEHFSPGDDMHVNKVRRLALITLCVCAGVEL